MGAGSGVAAPDPHSFQDIPVSMTQGMAVGDRETVARCTRDLLVVEPAAVAYDCTSGSFIRGPSR